MPVTIPRNEEMARRANELYVPGVISMEKVAALLGISKTSVARYVNPEYAENNRLLSVAAKRRRTGICERCGGETRYNGKTINGPSLLCDACHREPWTHCLYGHALEGENDLRQQGNGWSCRTCRNAYARVYHEQRYRTDPKFRERKRLDNQIQYAKRKARLESEEAPE